MNYIFLHTDKISRRKINNITTLKVISRFSIAGSVPFDGTVSYETLSKSTGVDEFTLKRIVRNATTMRIFEEPVKNNIRHTSLSKLITEPKIDNWLMSYSEEAIPAAMKVSLFSSPDVGTAASDTQSEDSGCNVQVDG